MTETPTIDLLSAKTFANGHPTELYTWMRQNDPVHWHDERDGRPGFWAIMRHADVRFVNSRVDLFSHAPSSVLEFDGEFNTGASMVNQDPPRHTAVRRAALPDFLPSAVRSRMGRMQQIAATLIDEVVERGRCDLVVDVAGRMASYVTADLLDIPRDDAVALYKHVEIGLSGPDAHTAAEILAARRAVEDYGRQVMLDRRNTPGDDVCSRLANDVVGDAPLTDDDFLSNFSLLVVGAGDTTRHLISGGMLALFEHPDQRALLAADLSGVLPTAIDEMLRWVTPVVYNRRMAIADCEIGGRQIRSGDKLAVYYGSANRDEAVFEHPFDFDVRRTQNPHMAFSGFGAHFCLGAHIARAEASAIFTEIFERMPDIQQSEPVTYDASNFVSGPAHLYATFTPGPTSGA